MQSVHATSISSDNIQSSNNNMPKTPNSVSQSQSKTTAVNDIDQEEQLLGQNSNSAKSGSFEIDQGNRRQLSSSASVASSSYTITPSTTSKYYNTQRRSNYSNQYMYANVAPPNSHDDTTSFFYDDWTTMQSLSEYLKRLVDYQQMDFESALDDMLTLLSTNPEQVFVNAKYRKHTKSHWARDDPAFAAIQIFFLVITSISYTITFRKKSITSFVFVLFRTVFLEWLLAGIIMASVLRHIANKYLRVQNRTHTVIQSVEWRYAFDIHCNAFFVFFLFTYILQFFFLPLLDNRSFVAMIFANAFYVIACTCYFYITHLGYRTLPFLTKTEVYFYPTVLSVIMFFLFFFLGLIGEQYRFNLTTILTRFFFA